MTLDLAALRRLMIRDAPNCSPAALAMVEAAIETDRREIAASVLHPPPPLQEAKL